MQINVLHQPQLFSYLSSGSVERNSESVKARVKRKLKSGSVRPEASELKRKSESVRAET